MGHALLGGVGVGVGEPVRLMAAINVSPESFFAASVAGDAAALAAAARQSAADGADFIDIGAMSTAPYLRGEVPVEEERRRMCWAVEVVVAAVSVPISADTTRSAVAAAALAAGARIINDVSGLRADSGMAAVAAQADGVVLMASPAGAAEQGGAAEPIEHVATSLRQSLARAVAAGVRQERIVLDPGIGFFTRHEVSPTEFNCRALDRLGVLAELGRPLLVGVSRKSFIGKITEKPEPADRLWGSLAAAAIAVYNGAAVIRTHDVAATRDAVRIAAAIRGGGHPGA